MGRRPKVYTLEQLEAMRKAIEERKQRKEEARLAKKQKKEDYVMFKNGQYNTHKIPAGFNYVLGYCEQVRIK